MGGASTGLAGCLGSDEGGRGEEKVWYTPEGEQLQLTIIAPSNGTWPLNAQTASATLTDFGIDVTTELMEKAAYGDAVQQSDFDLAIHIWGAGRSSFHPHAFYSSEYSTDRSRVTNVDPENVEVPMPVGDPEGSTETVDVTEKIGNLAVAATEEEQRTVIEELAWIYNQHLPRLPLMNGVSRAWLTSDDWELPPKQSQWMRNNGVSGAMRNGRITAKDGSDDEFTTATRRSNPNDMQWNMYFAQRGSTEPETVLFEPLVWTGNYPNDVEATALPTETLELAEDYEADDGTITVTVKDDRTWTDGDAVTAEDVATQYRLGKYLGQDTGDLWDSIEVTGDHEFELDIGDRNPKLVVTGLLATNVRVKRDSQYADWLAAFEEAENQDERDQIAQEVVTTRIEDHTSNAVWMIEDVSSSQVTLVPHDGHPQSDAINFETFVFESTPNNQTRWQALANDVLDGLLASSMPKDFEERLPKHTRRLPYNNTLGDAILINHAEPPFDDRRVRQALAFVVNRWTNTHNAKDFVDTIEYPIGLPNQQAQQYLGDRLEQYNRYGYKESQTGKAAQLLRDAGYNND
jgi:ABC-type transport system substrate-binding protein